MDPTEKVVPFKPPIKSGERKIFTAIPVRALVDPKDPRNCLSSSWKDRMEWEAFDEFVTAGEVRGITGRCRGMGTQGDSADLVCKYFNGTDPTAFAPLEANPDATLRSPDGKIARWGTEGPVRRCAPCIIGEQLIKKNRTA